MAWPMRNSKEPALLQPWSRQTTGASWDVIDLLSATLPRATLGSRVKTGVASPFKLRFTMQIASEETHENASIDYRL